MHRHTDCLPNTLLGINFNFKMKMNKSEIHLAVSHDQISLAARNLEKKKTETEQKCEHSFTSCAKHLYSYLVVMIIHHCSPFNFHLKQFIILNSWYSHLLPTSVCCLLMTRVRASIHKRIQRINGECFYAFNEEFMNQSNSNVTKEFRCR